MSDVTTYTVASNAVTFVLQTEKRVSIRTSSITELELDGSGLKIWNTSAKGYTYVTFSGDNAAEAAYNEITAQF